MTVHQNYFDVIVVGGGHAGTEAASASARMGTKTLLVTHSSETIGQMSCNPSIGGIGKGHLVKEIDALGGIMAHAADLSGIQFRTLNASKGPAVRATRGQMDRILYKRAIRHILEKQQNLTIFQDEVEDLIIKDDKIQGLITKCGWRFFCHAIILTTGTFLNGKIHIGLVNYQAGRAGEIASTALAKRLHELPLHFGRLKTGTPPRLDGSTINYTQLLEQPSDIPTPVFSFLGKIEEHPEQVSCYITHTNEKTHDIIRANLDRSPLYRGDIKGIGPRYCPSIEDKIIRFADKSSHQIFIEPEGLHTSEVYPNGLPTSLPFDVQYDFIHSILGFEHVHMTKPGYAIEYDFSDARDLKSSLETKIIHGLFFAGQINGTTGYEEAAAQGLTAGINASLFVQEKTPWTPKRNDAYIGVMIDDLITRGITEPYRMFTSRAEYRLILREDNADLRLTEKGRELGLVDDIRWKIFDTKREKIEKEKARLKATWIRPNTTIGKAVESLLDQSLSREYNLIDLLKRPNITYNQLMNIEPINAGIKDSDVTEQIEIQTKYSGYIERQYVEIERQSRYENTRIPDHFDYKKAIGLSTEVRQKLEAAKPETIGIASRIPGITPAAISLLLVHLKKKNASINATT